MGHYAYVLQPVRPTFPGDATPGELAIVSEHWERLQQLFADGTMIHIGRCEDGTFGLTIFKASSDDAAREIMESDPVIMKGIMTATLHPYRVLLHGKA